PEAKGLLELLRQISPDSKQVSLKEIRQWRKRLEEKPVSENGVVLPDAAESESCRNFLNDLLLVMEGAEHPSGKKGVTLEVMDRFRTLSAARLSWLAQLNEPDDLGR